MNSLKISIITPSYNEEKYIERAIKSVLDQDYINWEHIIIDGGSTDKTLGIIKKYKHLKWVSEKDNGQADAMNKGFKKSNGEIIVYLNANDYFLPNVFSSIIKEFENGADFVVGDVLVKSPRLNAEFVNTPKITLNEMLRNWEPNAFSVNSVGYFYKKEVQKACPFNADNYATMDLEFLLDAASKYKFTKIDKVLGCFEDGLVSKTGFSQTRLDYWQPKNFPYFEKYIKKMSEEEQIIYKRDRREGFALMQAHMNRLNKRPIELIDIDELPAVSVIMSTYNNKEYICKAVDSVLNQNLKHFEMIIVDDASTDNTFALLKEKYGKNSHIKLIVHKENQRQGAGRNEGIDIATGKYVFFLDADDWLDKGIFQHLISIAEKYNTEITVCGANTICGDTGEKSFYHGFDLATEGGIEALEYFTEYKIGSIVWNKLYLRDFLLKEKIRFISGYLYEDVIFSTEAVYKCKNYISISTPYYNYFQRSNSVVHIKPSFSHLRAYVKLYLDMAKFIQNNSLDQDFQGKYLSQKLVTAHCTNVVMPHLDIYISTRSQEEWESDLKEACRIELGAYGYAFSDFLLCLRARNTSLTLQPDQQELDLIRNSRGWKSILLLRKITFKLLPQNSTRRKIVKSVFQNSAKIARNLKRIIQKS